MQINELKNTTTVIWQPTKKETFNICFYLRSNSCKKRIEEDPQELFFEASAEKVDYQSSNDSAASYADLRENTLSSVTEFSASYIDNSETEIRSLYNPGK